MEDSTGKERGPRDMVDFQAWSPPDSGMVHSSGKKSDKYGRRSAWMAKKLPTKLRHKMQKQDQVTQQEYREAVHVSVGLEQTRTMWNWMWWGTWRNIGQASLDTLFTKGKGQHHNEANLDSEFVLVSHLPSAKCECPQSFGHPQNLDSAKLLMLHDLKGKRFLCAFSGKITKKPPKFYCWPNSSLPCNSHICKNHNPTYAKTLIWNVFLI